MLSLLLASSTTLAATGDGGVRARLDGHPLPLGQVGRYHCHDLRFPLITCYRSTAQLEAAVKGVMDELDGTDGVSAVSYVRIWEHAGDRDLRHAQQEPSPSTPSTEPAMPVLEGTWKRLSDPPFGSNSGAGAWTGEEVLVVDVPTGRVASYDVGADAWAALSDGPEGVRPEGLSSNSPTVWTGRELLLFDSMVIDASTALTTTHAFDPTTGAWRERAPAPFPASFAVWAGDRAIVADSRRRVAAYDPATDAWTELPRAPGSRQLQGLFWTGEGLLAVTTPRSGGVASAATLDPETGAWGAPVEGPVAEAVANEGLWAGDRLLFASGGPSTRTVPGVVMDATFDPATGAWTVVDYDCVGSATGLWTGELVVSPLGRHALDPTTGQCLALPRSDVIRTYAQRRAWETKVWTGREFVLWSGEEGGEGGQQPELVAISFTPAEG